MASMIGGLIQISIGLVVFAQVFMHTINNQTHCGGSIVNGSCTSGEWTGAEKAVFGILGIIGIAGIANGVANMFGMGF